MKRYFLQFLLLTSLIALFFVPDVGKAQNACHEKIPGYWSDANGAKVTQATKSTKISYTVVLEGCSGGSIKGIFYLANGSKKEAELNFITTDPATQSYSLTPAQTATLGKYALHLDITQKGVYVLKIDSPYIDIVDKVSSSTSCMADGVVIRNAQGKDVTVKDVKKGAAYTFYAKYKYCNAGEQLLLFIEKDGKKVKEETETASSDGAGSQTFTSLTYTFPTDGTYRLNFYRQSGGVAFPLLKPALEFVIKNGDVTVNPNPGTPLPSGDTSGNKGGLSGSDPALKTSTGSQAKSGCLWNPLSDSQDPNTCLADDQTGTGDTGTLIGLMLKLMKGFATGVSIWATFYIMIASFKLVISSGNAEKVQEGKRTIQWSLIAVVVSLTAFGIVSAVMSLFGVS